MTKKVNPQEIAERIQGNVPEVETPLVSDNSKTEAPVEPSRRDRFREGIQGRNADLNMDDEDAYYDYLDGQLAERDQYEGALDQMRQAIDESPEFAEMLVQASKQKDYSPIHFLLEKVASGDVDLDALMSDPDYADKFADAQKQALAKKESDKKLKDEAEKNFQSSLEMMKKVQEERGLSNEQVSEAMSKVYQIFDDLTMNKISEETFNAILDAGNYQQDVETAREEGRAQGLNTKVTDKLRKFNSTANRVGGGQQPMPEAKPQAEAPKKVPNMFGL